MSITIKIDDQQVLDAIDDLAQKDGLTPEEAASKVLAGALTPPPDNLAARLQARFAPFGGVVLPIPARPTERPMPFELDFLDAYWGDGDDGPA